MRAESESLLSLITCLKEILSWIMVMMMKTTITVVKMRIVANIYRALTMHCFKCFACLILLLHTTLL